MADQLHISSITFEKKSEQSNQNIPFDVLGNVKIDHERLIRCYLKETLNLKEFGEESKSSKIVLPLTLVGAATSEWPYRPSVRFDLSNKITFYHFFCSRYSSKNRKQENYVDFTGGIGFLIRNLV